MKDKEEQITETPKLSFDELGLHANILKGIKAIGFKTPTAIQAAAIPEILKGGDVIGCAQTGTGKTAAFVLPTLHRLLNSESTGHMRALIIAPTRELVLQSIQQVQDLSQFVPLSCAAIYGGVAMGPQIKALENGVDFVAATPGRLLDHVYSGRIDFVDLGVFVLDEMDRMLDMGFIPDIQRIMSLLPPEKQTLMFSATLPPAIEPIAHEFMHEPSTIRVGRRSSAALAVTQYLYPVSQNKKTDLLIHLLREHKMNSILIFTGTKVMADRLYAEIRKANFSVSVIHGDRDQMQRIRALDKFKTGKSAVLVATDVAARGIDVEDISHVVNYDVPHSAEDYVHRIGRTGRAAATGDAITLVTPRDEPAIAEIEKLVKKSIPRIEVEGFQPSKDDRSSRSKPGGRGGGRGQKGQASSAAKRRGGPRKRGR